MRTMNQHEHTPRQRAFEYRGHWLWKRRDTPNWHFYWYRPGSRRIGRRSAQTTDLDIAKRRLVEFVNGRTASQEQRTSDPKLLDILLRYAEVTMDGRPSQDMAFLSMDRWREFLSDEGVTRVSELNLDVQDRFIEWRRARPRGRRRSLSNATIGREFDVLRAALREYHKRGYLAQVPYVRGVPAPPPRERFLNEEECRRLLAACEEPHLYRFVLLALHTVQRSGAILDLRVEQVDLDRRRIDFLPPGALQSTKRRPVLPMTDTVHRELLRACRESQTGHVIEYLGQPVKKVRKSFKSACDRAGLEGVSPHTLRHSGATLLAAKGVSMREISGFLGHRLAVTTERYAKHSPDYLQNAAGALEGLFGDARAG